MRSTQRTHRGCCHTVLTGSCLGNDARLAHLPGQKYLAYGVVYLVRTGVVEVFALEKETASVLLAHAASLIQRRRTAHIVAQQGAVFLLEAVAFDYWKVGLLQVGDAFVEYLGHVGSAKLAIEAFGIYGVFSLVAHNCVVFGMLQFSSEVLA